MSDLPDPPDHVPLANIPDAVGKFRAIGGGLVFDGRNYTAGADVDAGGAALSKALRAREGNPIKDRLATLERLEEIYNEALQCQWRNLAVDHLPNPRGRRNPKAKCRPIVQFSFEDGSIESTDYR